jgi:hypothetical protein
VRRLVLAAGAVVLVACEPSVEVTPVRNAPHLAPSERVEVIHDVPPPHSLKLATLWGEVHALEVGAEGPTRACELKLADEAKKLGANLLYVTPDDRRDKGNIGAKAQCRGIAWRAP